MHKIAASIDGKDDILENTSNTTQKWTLGVAFVGWRENRAMLAIERIFRLIDQSTSILSKEKWMRKEEKGPH
ncbi:hypothetical protein RB195_021263 [Necator americanus]|uniref:Uncharacterized protein n=1 Tax=Necator americanus TaxID=51031 RepID=A0ABR1EAJ0_NECAM